MNGHHYAPPKLSSLVAKLAAGMKEIAPEHSVGGTPTGKSSKGRRAAKSGRISFGARSVSGGAKK